MADRQAESPRIVFMGSGPFAEPALTMLSEAYNVVAVITQPDRQIGRGRKSRRGAIAALADEREIPVKQPSTYKEDGAVEEVAEMYPDLLVVASYGRILPRRVLRLPARGALNLHPSLLPRHRGPSPIAGAILAGDTVTGVSVMEMVAKMDAGPVVAEREMSVDIKDTTDSLTKKLATENATLLLQCLPAWLNGEVKAKPQDDGAATYTAILSKEMGRVEWSKPAMQLEREIRAFVPWPVSYSSWPGGLIRIFGADAHPGESGKGVPGQVLGLQSNGITVRTGEGSLVLREVQGEGGRRMTAAEFTRGRPHIRQAILG